MPRTIRYHLDEHIDFAVTEGLRRRGVDVTTTTDAGLPGAGDPDHVAFAAANGRVLVTNDPDFLGLHDRGVEHPGIAYCHQQSRSIGEMIRALELIWEILEPEEMRNRVEFI
jgi:predicted nuclease of predicted toxin-antitoxin system